MMQPFVGSRIQVRNLCVVRSDERSKGYKQQKMTDLQISLMSLIALNSQVKVDTDMSFNNH